MALLVTGFPALRARTLVAALLEQDSAARVTLLVHPSHEVRAREVLGVLGAGERAEVLLGDARSLDFGLSRGEYLGLASNVRVLHHVHQVLDLGATREAAFAVNVGGAREVIEFARAARQLERVVHYSSVFVSGDKKGTFLERDLHAHQAFPSPVAASLALAEDMLRRHREVPLTVLRTGQLVGDSRTGVVDRLDGVYPLLVFLAGVPDDVPLPLPSRLDGPLHLVPVDYVARAALHLAVLPATLGETLHLVDPRPLSTARFLELAAGAFGKRLEPGFHASALGGLIGNPGVGLLAQKLRAVGALVLSEVTYDDACATRHLAGSAIACPPLESYLEVLVGHVKKRLAEHRLHDQASGEPEDAAS